MSDVTHNLFATMATLFGRHRLLLTSVVLTVTGVCLFGVSRVRIDSNPLRLLRSDKTEFTWLDTDFALQEWATFIVVEGQDLLTPEGSTRYARLPKSRRRWRASTPSFQCSTSATVEGCAGTCSRFSPLQKPPPRDLNETVSVPAPTRC